MEFIAETGVYTVYLYWFGWLNYTNLEIGVFIPPFFLQWNDLYISIGPILNLEWLSRGFWHCLRNHVSIRTCAHIFAQIHVINVIVFGIHFTLMFSLRFGIVWLILLKCASAGH